MLIVDKKTIKKGKSLIQSKTFWFNILAGVVAIASLFGFSEFQTSNQVAEIIATCVAVVNIILRLRTRQAITSIK